MTPIVFSELATEDLTEIWLHLGSARGPDFADRFIDDLYNRIGQLAEHPKLGRLRPEIRPNTRMLVMEPFMVLYDLTSISVRIVRVVHGKREMGKLKFDAESL